MQFVVEKQNAYFYIKTRTRKKPSRCQPGGWNSHLALPKSTGRTPGALQAPKQQNPAFSPTPNDAPVALQTTRDMGDMGGGGGSAKTATEAHGKDWMLSEKTNGVHRHRFELRKTSHRVPRALAMADAHEHPLTVFVHAGHGKNPQVRGQEACRCVRDGFVVHGRRNLDELVGRHELVGDRES